MNKILLGFFILTIVAGSLYFLFNIGQKETQEYIAEDKSEERIETIEEGIPLIEVSKEDIENKSETTRLSVIPEGYTVLEVKFSPDGKHVAYIASNDDKKVVIYDDQKSNEYDEIERLIFSNNSKRLAYVAYKECKKLYLGTCEPIVVLDGGESEEYSKVTRMSFSPDSSHFAYIARLGDKESEPGKGFSTLSCREECKSIVVFDNEGSKQYDTPYGNGVSEIIFSPDSKHFAYVAREADKQFVVFNGIKGKEYEEVDWLTFSSNSEHFTYVAREGKRDKSESFSVFNDIESERYGSVQNPIISKDSNRLAYIINRSSIIIDGKLGKEYEYVHIEGDEGYYFNVPSPIFSNDSKKIAYGAKDSGGYFIVINDEEGKRYELVSDLKFSPDSQHYVYIAKEDGDEFIVYDNSEGEKHDSYSLLKGSIKREEIIFSPDSSHFAYVMIGDCKTVGTRPDMREICKNFIFYDDHKIEENGYVRSIVFSPDSKHFAYIKENTETEGHHVVMDSNEGKVYDSIYGKISFTPDSNNIGYGALLGDELWWIVDSVDKFTDKE